MHPLIAHLTETLQKKHFIAGANGLVRDWQTNDLRQLEATYYGMITELDTQLGRVFSHLKKHHAWQNTIIIFTSDHGEMMGDHGLLGKHGFFDGSYHIPLIIRDPSQPAQSGHVVEHFTESVDIMPTVLDQLGMPLPVQLDGQSLLPFLKAETTRGWRSSAHWEYDFRNIQKPRAEKQLELASQQCNLAVIRDASFKYVHFAGLPPLLFDLTKHPDESVYCVNEAAYRDQRLSYAEALLCWRAEHLDQSLAMSMLTANGWSQRQPRTALR